MSAPESTDRGPLDGVRVVDLSVTLPGPFCTQLLRRLGAHVTHLVPVGGDPLARFAPAAYAWLAERKDTVEADLSADLDRQRALGLMRAADVVVEGWRPGVATRLGVGYDCVADHNPRVVYCSLSGYGASSELSGRPGHDINYVAEAGGLTLASTAGLPVADLAGGSSAATHIAAELCRAQRTGQGRHLDVSLTGSVVDWISAIGGSSYREFLQVYEAAHYGAFATRDEHVITLGVTLEQPLWAELITALGRPDWAELDASARTERRDELLTYLRGRIAELTSDELDVLLVGADTCWAWARVPGSPSRVSGGT